MKSSVFTVKEIAVLANVTPDAVRHYVKIGLLQPRQNPENRYREFSEKDLRYLRFIRRAKHLGFTLAEIKEIIRHSQDGQSPCPVVRQIIADRIIENRERLLELLDLQERMERALEQWQSLPDKLPDGDSICYLIEGVSGI